MSKFNPDDIKKLPVKVEFIMGRHKKTIKELMEFRKDFRFKLEESDAQIIVIEVNGKKIALGIPVRKKGNMHVQIIKLLNQ